MSENDLASIDGDDEYLLGGIAGSGSPTVIEIFGDIGLDFAFVDLEHAGFSHWDSGRLEELARAGELAGVDIIVRLPSGGPEAHPPRIRKVVDTGIRNLLIPRVESVQEVEAAVDAAHYYRSDERLGQRGLGAGRASMWGPGLRRPGYIQEEDAAVRVGVMLENESILQQLDELLALPDLGFVFPGTGDLSHALGQPLEFDHSAVAAALEEIESATADSDVLLGSVYVDDVEDRVNRGYQLLILGSDYGSIYDSLGAAVEAVRNS